MGAPFPERTVERPCSIPCPIGDFAEFERHDRSNHTTVLVANRGGRAVDDSQRAVLGLEVRLAQVNRVSRPENPVDPLA